MSEFQLFFRQSGGSRQIAGNRCGQKRVARALSKGARKERAALIMPARP
jgi:hypothetical protein